MCSHYLVEKRSDLSSIKIRSTFLKRGDCIRTYEHTRLATESIHSRCVTGTLSALMLAKQASLYARQTSRHPASYDANADSTISKSQIHKTNEKEERRKDM